ncbi:MAG: Maf family protein [Pseudomonadota bacterium]
MSNELKGMLDIERPLILATSSKARRELMKMTGLPFRVRFPKIDEIIYPEESPEDYVKRLAKEKALSIRPKNNNALIITVDTTVVCDEIIMGKPIDADDARRMLYTLSDRWHDVVSGIALLNRSSERLMVEVVSTRVKFIDMSDDMVDWYVATREPFGKAGSYAIQGKGAIFVEAIEGCFTNVIGLSLPTLINMLSVM